MKIIKNNCLFTKVFLRFFLSQFIEKYKPKLEEEKKEDFKKRKPIFVAQVLLILLFNIYC